MNIARKYRQKTVTPEHLLLALLDDPKVVDFLECDIVKINIETLKDSLHLHISQIRDRARSDETPRLSSDCVQLRSRASEVSRAFRNSLEPQSPVDLLIAILAQQTPASSFMQQEGVDFDFGTQVYSEFILVEDKLEEARIEAKKKIADKHAAEIEKEKKEQERIEAIMNDPRLIRVDPKGALANYCTNLNQLALEGKIGEVFGREGITEQVMEVLGQRETNNPILLGEAGVGKTVIVEGLARQTVAGDVPGRMKNKNYFALDPNALVAGTQYRGQFEERVKNLINELKMHKDAILFVDEAHLVMGAGAAEGSMDLSNILKPAMARGDIQVIFGTTTDEYNKSIRKNGAFKRRVQPVNVPAPNAEETLRIVRAKKSVYEAHHGGPIADEAIVEAVNLADRHIHETHFPHKAFNLIDRAMSRATLRNPGALTAASHIREIISKDTDIPLEHLVNNGAEVVLKLEQHLNERVVNQTHAAEMVTAAVKRSTAGTNDPNRPLGSFMFLGGTGTGKTEFAEALRDLLHLNLIKLDMSDYMEKMSASRISGAAPGYVGYEEGGFLTEAVRKNPHSVILFDEIEKAHPDVFNQLLQVLDKGYLTDSQGNKIDFRKSIIIMTGNIQAEHAKKMGYGASNDAQKKGLTKDSPELKRFFRLEFLNRIDEIVTFNNHSKESMLKLTDIFLARANKYVAAKGITIESDTEVKNYLSEKGYDPVYGARPLRKVVEKEITNPVTDAIITGDLKKGGTALVTMKDGGLSFIFNNPAEPEMPKVAVPDDLPPVPPYVFDGPGSLSIN